MDDSNAPPAAQENAWRTALTIMLSLPMGVSLLAAVALWLRSTSPAPAAGDPATLTLVWVVLTVATSLAAVVVWRRMVRPHVPPTGFRADPPPAESIATLQTGLIVCMALVEGAALFGGVLLIIGAGPMPALVGVILIWTAFFVLRPRRGWYGLR